MKPIIDKKISTENLSGKVEPVALENFKSEDWQHKKLNWTFSYSLPIKIH